MRAFPLQTPYEDTYYVPAMSTSKYRPLGEIPFYPQLTSKERRRIKMDENFFLA
jgi:hypothetical protein